VCLQAVENPSCAEIRDVLTAAGMNVYVEVSEGGGGGGQKDYIVSNMCFPEQNAPQRMEQRRPVQRASQSSGEAGRRKLLSGQVHLP